MCVSIHLTKRSALAASNISCAGSEATLMNPMDISTASIHMPPQQPPSTSADAVLLLALCSSCVQILAPMKSALFGASKSSFAQAAPKDQSGLVMTSATLFAQCYYWAVYGHLIGQYDIFRFNSLGAVMCLAYLAFLCKGSIHSSNGRSYVGLAVTGILTTSLLVLRLPMALSGKAQVCAYLAMVFSFLQSSTPLIKALEMIREGYSSGFPWTIAVSSCVSNILWADYALLVHDEMYFASNMLNMMVASLALALGVHMSFSEGRGRGSLLSCDADAHPLMPRMPAAWFEAGIHPSGQKLNTWSRAEKQIHCYDSCSNATDDHHPRKMSSWSPFGMVQISSDDASLDGLEKFEPDCQQDKAPGRTAACRPAAPWSMDCIL